MAASTVPCGNSAIREFPGLAVQKADYPADRPDEPCPGETGPGHGLRPVKVVEDAREHVGEDVFGGTASLDVLGGQILALGSLHEVDFVQSDALLLGEANRGACRRADHVVGYRLWRTGYFLDDISLAYLPPS